MCRGVPRRLLESRGGPATLVGEQALGSGVFVMAGDSHLFADDNEGSCDKSGQSGTHCDGISSGLIAPQTGRMQAIALHRHRSKAIAQLDAVARVAFRACGRDALVSVVVRVARDSKALPAGR
jgi:hypothetical protein